MRTTYQSVGNDVVMVEAISGYTTVVGSKRNPKAAQILAAKLQFKEDVAVAKEEMRVKIEEIKRRYANQ